MKDTSSSQASRHAWSPRTVVAIVLAAFLVAGGFIIPVFVQAQEAMGDAVCRSNLKQLSLGVSLYAQDYDERLPLADAWQKNLNPYIKNIHVFFCPDVDTVTFRIPDSGWLYAYNSAVAGQHVAQLSGSERLPVFFDSHTHHLSAEDVSSKGYGSPLNIYPVVDPFNSFERRHRGYGNVAYYGPNSDLNVLVHREKAVPTTTLSTGNAK